MKYAREVIGLLAAFPGREFRMAQIVRHVAGRSISDVERNAVRQGVKRVLLQLCDSGQVMQDKDGETSAFYVWSSKLQHEHVANCNANCNNTARAIVS